jgi:AmmeMemoRadiSam system protein A
MKKYKETIPKEILFEIARESIKAFLTTKSIPDTSKYYKSYPKLKEKKGSFVTLYIDEQLKGCIGRLEGERSLADDISVNAIDAAFYDNRFPPLAEEEFIRLKIEISLLTKPEKFIYQTEEELFKKIFENKYGVILKMGINKSTYLPQVWESYSNPQTFMRELAFKGGFPDGVWNNKECEVFTYTAEVFSEN